MRVYMLARTHSTQTQSSDMIVPEAFKVTCDQDCDDTNKLIRQLFDKPITSD